MLVAVLGAIGGPPLGMSLALARPAAGLSADSNFAPHVETAARRFGIPEAWIWGVMRTESAGNSRAVSVKGAMGLMQLMPATWSGLTARYGLGSDPFDIAANIHAGTAYLREMFDRYGDLPTALAAYNAGPGRVDQWRSQGRPLPTETVNYVAQIVPSVGSGAPSVDRLPSPIAPQNLLSWRGAQLFVSRAATVSGNELRNSSDPQNDRPEAISGSAGLAGPRGDSLFVARAGQD
ncbi:lytic transglycosylase domain-containing protein [Novosphingobium sp. CECT 9465]|uniref:lytic transglycosylase domain-containing protein n=1 Tax=Novosphingobium sp. CECT 9465 TaxID=2829794 RepID=UPI002096E424|nr:lytic transglycosylase domain-containing protein [Novosphingobium sp. CECT 9465]